MALALPEKFSTINPASKTGELKYSHDLFIKAKISSVHWHQGSRKEGGGHKQVSYPVPSKRGTIELGL